MADDMLECNVAAFNGKRTGKKKLISAAACYGIMGCKMTNGGRVAYCSFNASRDSASTNTCHAELKIG